MFVKTFLLNFNFLTCSEAETYSKNLCRYFYALKNPLSIAISIAISKNCVYVCKLNTINSQFKYPSMFENLAHLRLIRAKYVFFVSTSNNSITNLKICLLAETKSENILTCGNKIKYCILLGKTKTFSFAWVNNYRYFFTCGNKPNDHFLARKNKNIFSLYLEKTNRDVFHLQIQAKGLVFTSENKATFLLLGIRKIYIAVICPK